MLTKIQALREKYLHLEEQLSDPGIVADVDRSKKVNKEYKKLQPIVLAGSKYEKAVNDIKSAVDSIKTDNSGVERTFSAVLQAVDKYKTFRTQEPRRNVMIVIFSDEVGDDETDLDRTVAACRKFEMPVYVVGVICSRRHFLI